MTVKHATPGPWRVRELVNGTLAIYGAGEFDIVFPKRSALQDADTRLIAQAPALLKALRELLEFSEYDPTDMPAHEYEACKADAQTRARAAISAAEEG